MSIPTSVIDGTNPTHLPPRYEIRQLTSEHIEWAKSIVMHSNMFCSPMWPVIYPENKIRRLHSAMKAGDYLIRHQIESGMSFGIFDLQYEYKRPESAKTNGRLYWQEDDLESDKAALVEQMDFPLASVALAYDGFKHLDMAEIMPLIEVLPLFGTMYHMLEEYDERDPASWQAVGPTEVLLRNATSTREDYEGEGLMKKLAQWLMREAALKGYRGIQIECAHDAVTHTWLNAPEPFKSKLISRLDTAAYEEENEKGEKTHPFAPSKQVCTKVYVTLKGDSNDQPRPSGATFP